MTNADKLASPTTSTLVVVPQNITVALARLDTLVRGGVNPANTDPDTGNGWKFSDINALLALSASPRWSIRSSTFCFRALYSDTFHCGNPEVGTAGMAVNLGINSPAIRLVLY